MDCPNQRSSSAPEARRTTDEREAPALRSKLVELERQLERLVEVEEEARGARAQAQALLDNIPHMAWMKDTQGVFLAVNEPFARACGMPREKVLGRTDRDVWPRELAERYIADDLLVMRNGEKFYAEEPIAEAGDVRWFETFKTPIFSSTGLVMGTVGLACDITERKRAEERQKAMERRIQEMQKLESLGVLAGGIAHDFNNLLVGVLANAELLQAALRRAGAEPSLLERVAGIKSAAVHASELTNQMLAYSGRGHFDVRSISLTAVVREMDHLLTASISKKAVVKLELEQNLPAVEADVAQMRQVIMNLLINASDALGEEPGVIRVRTGKESVAAPLELAYGHESLAPGRYVYLEVRDDGCGMNVETRARLFEPFFTTKFAGRGLGLSAVQGIIRGHGGGIVLHTELGAGTTVKVLLPETDRPPTNVASPSSNPPSEWTGSGLVLLVEDDARVRAVTELLLHDIGFQVLSVSNGRDAISEFDRRAEEVKLVVLDLTMPDLGGDEVLKSLRQRRPDIPVLICSGYSQEEMHHRLNHDDAAFLQKPYSAKALRSRLMELLGAQRQTD